MKFKTFAAICILVILAACTASQTAQPVANTNPADTSVVLPATFTSPPPTSTQIPTINSTPTSTLEQHIIILTHETPDLMLTSANLQLGQSNLELTQAANQIATLENQSSALKTQLSAASTQAAAIPAVGSTSGSSSSGSSGSSSGGSTSGSSNQSVPSSIYTAVATSKTLVYFTKRDNNAGYPIMEIYEPRVKFQPGTVVWVYPEVIRADGADYFYKSYDPDGQSSMDAYFRYQDIQVRSAAINNKYPSNAAMAEFKQKCVAHYYKRVDSGGKPIMITLEPRIRYESGSQEVLISKFVVATGGSHWYPIYDPDGKPSTFIHAECVKFLYTWE